MAPAGGGGTISKIGNAGVPVGMVTGMSWSSQAIPFRDYMFELIDSGQNDLVIDLSQVDFMDSSGLGAIVAVFKQLSGDGTVQLAAPQQAVRDLFDLTCMHQIFVSGNSSPH